MLLELLLPIVLAIVFIIVSISRWAWHPVFSLLVASLGLGFVFGLDGATTVQTVSQGFGSILGGIGLIVVFGSIIGVALEKSGAAVQIAERVLQWFGPRRPALAVAVIGALTSIPVFCDSGFILLNGLNKSLAKRSGASLGVLSLSLAAGLYTTHTLVPPTPGPIAAAGQLGADDYIGTIMLLGVVVAIPVIYFSYRMSTWLGQRITVTTTQKTGDFTGASLENTANLPKEESVPPSLGLSFLPLLLPIVLIAAGTVVRFIEWQHPLADLVLFTGQPLMALLLACLPAYLLARKQGEWSAWCTQGVKLAGPILIITGAGGAFGAILKASALQRAIEDSLGQQQLSFTLLLCLAFVIAALLKTAQGSSTNALVITAGMMAPIAAATDLATGTEYALLVLAIGAGAMTVSHANDSYFWVVTRFSGIPVGQAYRTYTVLTGLMGLVSFLMVWLLSVILGYGGPDVSRSG
ncbi:MAG: GntP family permease [Bacteroidota bacterium]